MQATLKDVQIGETMIIDGLEFVFKGFKKDRINRIMGTIIVRQFVLKADKRVQKLFTSRMNDRVISKISDGKFEWT